MTRTAPAALAVLLIHGAASVALAKGPTTRIVITGTSLATALEVSDPEALKPFYVWSGPATFSNGVEAQEGFIIDWASGAATQRPQGLRTYEVAFYVRYANRPLDEQPDQLAYIVTYATNPATGQGYVYLPGKEDTHYSLNTRALLRGLEGRWFRATAGWQATFERVVVRPDGRRD